MRRPLLSLAVLFCFAAGVAAQTAAPEKVCEVHVNRLKPGMTAQYEQGRARHMAWHKSQNDSWSWATWEIATGKDTGAYLISSCGHTWKDFDAREQFNVNDTKNAFASMGATLAGETMAYYVIRPELSSESQPGPPPAYLSVIYFHLKPEGVTDFLNGVKQVNEAFSKTNTPRGANYWYMLANGGAGPELVLVQERKSIAEMAGISPKTLDDIMKEAYGDQGASNMTAIRKAYSWSESELLHYRPDLSYMAPESH
jgi:hypothetical protein